MLANSVHTDTYTHQFNGPFPGLPGWAGTRKVKPICILPKQDTASGSGTSWDICKSAPHSTQTTMPALHHSVFLQAGCHSCRLSNNVKALEAPSSEGTSVHLYNQYYLLWSAPYGKHCIQAGCPSCRPTNSVTWQTLHSVHQFVFQLKNKLQLIHLRARWLLYSCW